MPDTPVYTEPSDQSANYLEQLLGLFPDLRGRFSDLMGQVQGGAPSPFLDTLPYSANQIAGYGSNLITGKYVPQRVEGLREEMMGDVNRTFGDVYNRERQKISDTGMRKSSFHAKKLQEGKGQLAGARSGVTRSVRDYEDRLRREDMAKGFNVLGGLESGYRGDEAATSGFLNQLMQLFGMDAGITGGEAGALETGIGGETTQQQMLNNWLMQLFQIEEGSDQGGGFNPWDLLPLAGLFI